MPQTIEELINDRLNKLHKIKIAKLMRSALASQIYEHMPKDQIYESNKFIEWIKSNVGENDDQLIQQAIEALRNGNKLIEVEQKGLIFYRKLDLS